MGLKAQNSTQNDEGQRFEYWINDLTRVVHDVHVNFRAVRFKVKARKIKTSHISHHPLYCVVVGLALNASLQNKRETFRFKKDSKYVQ